MTVKSETGLRLGKRFIPQPKVMDVIRMESNKFRNRKKRGEDLKGEGKVVISVDIYLLPLYVIA